MFSRADVVVSRSGAGTLAELTALGEQAVFIPLATSAGKEQAYDALYLAEAGAAVALLGDVTADRLRDGVGPLLAIPRGGQRWRGGPNRMGDQMRRSDSWT
ncbi:glycosyltransferase [Streptomyces nigra]|uniref:glycosyltransferase n=1 Tax=Streptomyces nigra TaxID=1827580 RepID=UPI0037F4EA23